MRGRGDEDVVGGREAIDWKALREYLQKRAWRGDFGDAMKSRFCPSEACLDVCKETEVIHTWSLVIATADFYEIY